VRRVSTWRSYGSASVSDRRRADTRALFTLEQRRRVKKQPPSLMQTGGFALRAIVVLLG
jgi:hypothetical protein